MRTSGSRWDNRRRDNSEAGSVTMLIGLTMTLMLGMVVVGMAIGRYSMYEREVQNAADAAALAAAYSLQQIGKPGGGTSVNEKAARDVIDRNSRIVLKNINITPLHRWKIMPQDNRALIQVDLTATFDTFQEFIPDRNIEFSVQAFAQINEVVYSENWPALTIILDASDSMDWPILGTSGFSAWQILENVITTYAGNTLPIRNGLVIYKGVVVAEAPPPIGGPNGNNITAITNALGSVTVPVPPTHPQKDTRGKTNTYRALEAARLQQQSMPFGRNVLLISDGEPTAGPCDETVNPACHFTIAETMAGRVRNEAGASLFTVEIARTNSTPDTREFLENIAGPAGPGSPGDDPMMYRRVQSLVGIVGFLRYFAYNICAFGPLNPGPGVEPAAMDPPILGDTRMRPVIPDLATVDRQRVKAFIQYSNGAEQPLTLVPPQCTYPAAGKPICNAWSDGLGFELFMDTIDGKPEAFVILTFDACNELGRDARSRLVVRWGEPELTGVDATGEPTLR